MRWATLVVLACGCSTRTSLDTAAIDSIADAGIEDAPPVADVVSAGPLGCAPGAPPVSVASRLGVPHALRLAAWDVYFADHGAIVRVSKAGGAAERLASDHVEAADLALSDGALFWNAADADEVRTRSLENGATRVLYKYDQRGASRGIAADRDAVYWAFDSNGEGVVRRADRIGKRVVPIGRGADIRALAIDDAHVYWARRDGVFRAAKDGSGGALVVRDSGVVQLAVDDDAIYYLREDRKTRAIVRVAHGARTPEVLFSSEAPISGIAASGGAVFFTVTSGSVARIPARGGPVTTIARGRVTPRGAPAVDASCVYWIEGGSGTSAVVRASALTSPNGEVRGPGAR